MPEPSGRLANLVLRYAAPFFGLRRLPVLGGLLSWTSRRLVQHDSLIWVQIAEGPAKDLWMRVNPRTGQTVQKGNGEPEVQRALAEHLRPGMTFYDLGAIIFPATGLVMPRPKKRRSGPRRRQCPSPALVRILRRTAG